ncbi:hypothetical protein C5167_003789 [Papaver somniferum]|uniref:Uncharacterized protein n=1 Tax=Papaver somniferum TaxID=3469 RepID=A0A4Y7L5C3_PAPSO|nr:hypothetical protein C5167_003789 [Papaver somniferum]
MSLVKLSLLQCIAMSFFPYPPLRQPDEVIVRIISWVTCYSGSLHYLGNASIVPVIQAQTTPGYMPHSQFYKIEAILRPCRVEQVSLVEEVIAKIIEEARTGEIGDGKIFYAERLSKFG